MDEVSDNNDKKSKDEYAIKKEQERVMRCKE